MAISAQISMLKEITHLNPRTAGGAVIRPLPLRDFADSEKKTAAHSAAKFAIAVQPTI